MSVIDAINRFLGDPAEKELKKYWPLVEEVKAMHGKMGHLTLSDLPKKT